MQRTLIRWAVFVGLVAFLPSLYYLAVVGQIHWTNAYALYASEALAMAPSNPLRNAYRRGRDCSVPAGDRLAWPLDAIARLIQQA